MQQYGMPKKKNTGLIIAVSVVAFLVVFSFVFVATKRKECEGCGETKLCTKYEVTLSYGGNHESKTGWLCDDCYKEMKDEAKEYENYGAEVKIKRKSW